MEEGKGKTKGGGWKGRGEGILKEPGTEVMKDGGALVRLTCVYGCPRVILLSRKY